MITFTPFSQAYSAIRSLASWFTSSCKRMYSLSRINSFTEFVSFSVIVPQAPDTMAISFWLVFSSTRISAIPVLSSSLMKTCSFVIPSSSMVCKAISPKLSFPIFVTIVTSAPALWAAAPWLKPFPPGPILNIGPFTVSPGTGRCGILAIRSTTKLPNTTTLPAISQPPVPVCWYKDQNLDNSNFFTR